jgi:hypothetical protein
MSSQTRNGIVLRQMRLLADHAHELRALADKLEADIGREEFSFRMDEWFDAREPCLAAAFSGLVQLPDMIRRDAGGIIEGAFVAASFLGPAVTRLRAELDDSPFMAPAAKGVH